MNIVENIIMNMNVKMLIITLLRYYGYNYYDVFILRHVVFVIIFMLIITMWKYILVLHANNDKIN